MASRINPAAFSNAFAQQVQLGAQMRTSDQEEQQRQLQLDRAQAINALGKDPNATPEQYVRAGDAASGNALASMQETQQVRQAQAFPRIGAIAAQISQIADPAQKRAAFKQAIVANGSLFDTMGMPHTDALAKLDQTDDATLDATLSKLSTYAPKAAPVKLEAGASLVRPNADGTYDTAFTAPAADKEPSAVAEYKMAQSQGYKGTFFQYQKELKQAGAQINLPSGYKWNADGSMSPITGGPADPNSKNKPPGEADKKASLMFDSMVNAEGQLAALPNGGADTSSLGQRVLGSNPLTAPLQSDEFRRYEAGGLRWAANMLYLKSGATASPDEIRSTWKQFFPQPGEGPDVRAQKQVARNQEMQSVAKAFNLDPSKIPALPSAGPGPAAAAPQVSEGSTATGPGGRKLVLRGGQWVPQ